MEPKLTFLRRLRVGEWSFFNNVLPLGTYLEYPALTPIRRGALPDLMPSNHQPSGLYQDQGGRKWVAQYCVNHSSRGKTIIWRFWRWNDAARAPWACPRCGGHEWAETDLTPVCATCAQPLRREDLW